MLVQEGLPTAGAHVNVRDLHPELKARLRLLFATWPGNPIQIRSGARSYAHQKRLYDAYVARGRTHPIVANPDRGYGSKHQVRPLTYRHGNLRPMNVAYAVDLMWRYGYPTLAERAELRAAAGRAGLEANVPTEWWHFQPTYNGRLIEHLPPPPKEAAVPLRDWDTVYLRSAKPGDYNAAVELWQRILRSAGYNAGPIDGRVGPQTEEANRRYMAGNGRQAKPRPDGPTWNRMLKSITAQEDAVDELEVISDQLHVAHRKIKAAADILTS